MDDVSRFEFQRSPMPKRGQVFDSMVDKAFSLDGGQRAYALHFNALLVTELRERSILV